MNHCFLNRWNHVLVSFLGFIGISGFLGSFLGCVSKSTNTPSQLNSTLNPSKTEARIVNLAIWSNYITPELLAKFKEKTGIQVQVANYSSNEELLAKLQAGASSYDLAVPSDYMVYVMSKLGLLRELDYSLLPNSKSLDPKYLKKPFDPQNKFSVPYDWGTTGIGINRSIYSGSIKGWKDLFQKEDLAGKFSLMDDAREVIGAALKAQNFSLNSKSITELNQAKELLLKARVKVKAFTSEPLMPLVNGEIAVAHIVVSDALQARKATGGKIEYLIPEEGGTFWIDNLVIPAGAKNIKEAYELMNYLLEGQVSASTVKSVFVSPTNKDAFALLPKDLQRDPALFPSVSALVHCEMIQDLDDFLPQWDRVWTEVKAH